MGRLCGLGSVIFMHWPLMYENFNQSVSIKGQPLYSLSRVSILSSSFEISIEIYWAKWNPDCLFWKSIHISKYGPCPGQGRSWWDWLNRWGCGSWWVWVGFGLTPWNHHPFFKHASYWGKLPPRTIVIHSALGKSKHFLIRRIDHTITSLNHCLLACVILMHHIEAIQPI